MAALGVNIKQEQSPIGQLRKTVETTGESTLVKLAVQELEEFFHKKIQNIKALLEDRVVADKVSDRRVNDVEAGRRGPERNNISELEHQPRGYNRQRQHDELNQHICPTCGSTTWHRRVFNAYSRIAASDQVVDEGLSSENGQKSSNQSGAKESFHDTPTSEKIIEEKLSGTDKLTSPTHPKKAQLRRTNVYRPKRGFGALSRKRRDRHANQRASTKQLWDYKQMLLRRNKVEIQAKVRGKVEEADQKERTEFFESPLLMPGTGQQHWSDELGEHSYSDESVTLMELPERKMFNGFHLRSTSGSEDANFAGKYPMV